jgi:mannonate dehydratase
LGTPLYDLLGGKSRDAIMVYGHANGAGLEDTVEAVGRYIELGYRAVRAQSGVPGVDHAYGVGRGDLYYEPADAALPTETIWCTHKYLNFMPKVFDRLREVHGSTFICYTTATIA